MSNTQGSLDAAASERKARLAKLASLKRKQPGADTTITPTQPEEKTTTDSPSATDIYISGRNYDTTAKAPKLGFESVPGEDVETIEKRAERLAAEAKERAEKDEAENEKGIDLFKLQPKKPNWDLKRELAEKMKVLDVRTQNAIARMVRERIESSKKEAQSKSGSQAVADGGEEVGMEGTTLAEAVREREREDEAERQQDELEEEGEGLP
jgi:coiled-coil domain-containing protein 12